MIGAIRRWLDRRTIARSCISDQSWQEAFAELPVLDRLDKDERKRLMDLAILFLDRKVIKGVNGVTITESIRLIIALQACLPILKLGIRCYRNWVTVVVYPAGFVANHVEYDELGLVRQSMSHRLGEAWVRGPVVLSLADTRIAGKLDGSNLVIHEFAHKLDMQNGRANGFPPLHRGMSRRQWTDVFSAAFSDHQSRCQRGQPVDIDCYGATSPAEFFAVISEVFFEQSGVIEEHYPDVLELLIRYYRQNPKQATLHEFFPGEKNE